MSFYYSKKSNFLVVFLAFLVSIVSIFSGIFSAISKRDVSAYTSTPTATIGELWNSLENKFNPNNLKALKTKLGSLYTNVSSTQNYDSQAISKQAVGDTSGLIIKLGGLTWVATYLSKANSGDTILTLLLTDSAQLANKTYTNKITTLINNDSGDRVIELDNGKFSDKGEAVFTPIISDGTEDIPVNMYGTSFMRSIVLNNGGKYLISTNETVNYDNTNSGSIFAPFTTGELSNYIVTPNQVSWQRTYSKRNTTYQNTNRVSYDLPNELLDITSTKFKWASGKDYTNKTGYTAWGNDKLWLPSYAEIGTSNSGFIWDVSKNMVNISNISGMYTRSASYEYDYAVIGLQYGYAFNEYAFVFTDHAVCPALHLNLTSSFQQSSIAKMNAESTPSLNESEFEYNGSAWNIATASQGSSVDMANFLNYDSTLMKVFYDQNGQTNPGIYNVVFTIIDPVNYIFDNGTTEVTYTWKIIKRVAIPTLKTTKFIYAGSTIYAKSSTGTDPSGTDNIINYSSSDYSISNTSANTLGIYQMTFTLPNIECYKWDDNTTTAKTASWSIVLAKPTLKTSEFKYNGSVWYIASASNTDSGTNNFENYNDKVEYSTYSELSAKDAGTYCVVFYIKDSGTTWVDGTTDPVLCKWTITAVQTYSITFNLTYDSTCDTGVSASVVVQQVDENGETLTDGAKVDLPAFDVNTANIGKQSQTVSKLAGGYYKITVIALGTNHIATITNILFGTDSTNMTVDLQVTKNNYGAFYSSSTSTTTLKNTKVNGVVSVLSLSGGEVKTISSGLTTITEYNIKNIVLLTAFVTAITALLVVGIICLKRQKSKKKKLQYVLPNNANYVVNSTKKQPKK